MTDPLKLNLTTGSIAYYQQQAGDASHARYLARFVRAGRIRTAANKPGNIVIQPQAIRSAFDRGLFDQKAVFLDHAGFFDNPSLDNLVGVATATDFNETDQSIDGYIVLYNTPSGNVAKSIIDELLAPGSPAPDIGLSIVFYPRYERENDDYIITDISHVESVDLVFQPAADGRILQALSALTIRPIPEKETAMSETPVSPEPTHPDKVPELFANEWQYAAQEATRQAAIKQILAASGLPEPAKQRLSLQNYQTPEDLDVAIAAERAYLAMLQESNVIHTSSTPPRGGNITNVRDSLDRITLAAEALFAGEPPPAGVAPLTGIRELYHLLSGDYEMTGLFQPDRIQFANVTTSTMAQLTANVLNKRLANEFIQYPKWWEPIVIAENFQSLQNVKWITLGGVGELPTVAEGAAYTELTWDDAAESASFVKKGGYLGITLEAIDKDDVGRVRAAPRALAQAAWLTLSKAISGIFTQSSGVGPTMSDSLALFHSSHGNLGTSALSVSTYSAARLAMRKQTELNSAARLGALTAPKFLLVPPDLEITALQILASEVDYTYALANAPGPAPANVFTDGSDLTARMNFARSRVIVVDLWTDTNDWAAVADPRLWPTIGLAYRYGATPEIFSVASPTAGLMFTNDTMPVKVRYFFATGPIDYRGLYKANVA